MLTSEALVLRSPQGLALRQTDLSRFEILHGQDTFVGEVGLTLSIEEVDYWIVRQFRGRGFAPEALQLFTQWAFENLWIPHITASVDSSNRASRRVLEKCGFVLVLPKTYPLRYQKSRA